MVTIHPISETIPPEPNVVQLEVDPNTIILLPEHLDLEIEKPEVFHVSVTPHSIEAIESPMSRSQPPDIYLGPDGEILPPIFI